jgi:hypothetical protein
MDETTYKATLTQFLNDYWGAFHEVLEAQSVNPRWLADSLFDTLVDAHRRFVALDGSVDPAAERLERLWAHVVERRKVTSEAPLVAREVAHARTQFETIYDTLMAAGGAFPDVGRAVLTTAAHGSPRTPLRADAAR